jgi:hypothetical protein
MSKVGFTPPPCPPPEGEGNCGDGDDLLRRLPEEAALEVLVEDIVRGADREPDTSGEMLVDRRQRTAGKPRTAATAVRMTKVGVDAAKAVVVERHRDRDVRRAARDPGENGGEREIDPGVEMDDLGLLAMNDLAHRRGDLWVIPVQVPQIQRREAIDDDAFGGNLASRREVEAWLAGDHHDLVLHGQRPGEPANMDLGAALPERRVEAGNEADLHAAF